MARIAKATKTTTKPAAPKRKPDRPVAIAQKPPLKAAKAAAAPKRTPVAAPPAPKISKDELRTQVEKLEGTVATLRTKNREANRAAKTAAARIAELEEQVAQFEKQAVAQTAPAKRGLKPSPVARSNRGSKGIDPGDAVPPGVAVEESGALDQEAVIARENLDEHLGGE
jgi:hypothetical protein